MRVLVVGAGIAGLTALHTLREAGVDAVALEAQPVAGGRLRSERRAGYTLELGAQFSFRGYRATFALCERLGLLPELRAVPRSAALYQRATLYPIEGAPSWRRPWLSLERARAFERAHRHALRRLPRLVPTLLRHRARLTFTDQRSLAQLDHDSFAVYARQHLGEAALEQLLQPLVSAMTLGEPEDVSARYGMVLVRAALGGLFTLESGVSTLTQRLHERHRERVVLGTPVRRIAFRQGRAVGVETDHGLHEADHVVCATTASAASRLLPSLFSPLKALLAAVTYSSSTQLFVGVRGALLPAGCYALGLPRASGSFYAGVTDDAVKSPHLAPPGHGLLHGFTVDARAPQLASLPHDALLHALTEELRRWLPTLPRAPALTLVQRWPEAVCLASPALLVQRRRLGPGLHRVVPGLKLAGEYLYAPSVEGAVTSGLDAARAILESS